MSKYHAPASVHILKLQLRGRLRIWRYFIILQIQKQGLKRLICTSFQGSKVIGTKSKLYDDNLNIINNGRGYVLDVSFISEGDIEFSDEFIEKWLKEIRPIKSLKNVLLNT